MSTSANHDLPAPDCLYLVVKRELTRHRYSGSGVYEEPPGSKETEIVGVISRGQIDNWHVVSIKEGQEDHPLFLYAKAAIESLSRIL